MSNRSIPRSKANDSVSTAQLQPSLLDRLTDDEPQKNTETREERVLTKARMRECVLRDLGWLLNTSNHDMDNELQNYPEVARSVVNFGMRPLSGLRLSEIEWTSLEQHIQRALLDFEPRILPETLEVKALVPEDLLHHHNKIAFEIHCQIWAKPYPLDMLLRTNLDLESGEMRLQDLSMEQS